LWSAARNFGEWLKGIGLVQNEATYLEKIRLPLGARKRLMKAIANLVYEQRRHGRTGRVDGLAA
jgi:hypothetical protein